MSITTKEHGLRPEQLFDGFSRWSDNWANSMQDAEQRLQRFQHVADELNNAIYRTSLSQMEELFTTFTRMSELLSRAREPGELISAQPEVFRCVVEAAESSNRRLLELAAEVRHCGIEMIGNDDSVPGTSGKDQRVEREPAAASGDAARKAEESRTIASA